MKATTEDPDVFAREGRIYHGNGNGKRGGADAGERPRFDLVAFADITLGNQQEWLVADIVPAGGFTIIYGESGCGKSFLASDMGLAVALGQPWGGKDVQAGTVVYVTAEGATGFRKRLVAYRQHNNIAGVVVPFHVIAAAPDMGHKPGDPAALIAAIKRQAAGPIRAVMIDTLARTMQGADENSAADMGVFADNCATIGQRLGCAVLALHHCGKDSGKGARGSSALRAASDCEVLVEGSQERRTATVTKAKDGEEGWALPFRLNRVDIDTPERSTSSCILETLGDWGIDHDKPTTRRKLSNRQKLALDALGDLAVDGKPLPAEWQMPMGIRAVPIFTWRAEMEKRGVLDTASANPRADFKRLKDSLQARHLIGEQDALVWKA